MSITSTLRPSALGAVGTDASDLEALCAHCRLPVLESPLEISDDHQFCCAGCRTAFTILHDHGLDQFYRFGERRGVRVTSSGRTFDEFDHEAFQALYVRQTTAGLSSVELYLEGVHCASCVWLVERVP
ncbi:MAG: heavy metal translocating P-type ATPase metal-binding domain-containing protein, partial [Gemmatimonadaceae bacterium]